MTNIITDTDAVMLMDMDKSMAMVEMDMDFKEKISQSQLKSTTNFSNTAKNLKSKELKILTKEDRKQ